MQPAAGGQERQHQVLLAELEAVLLGLGQLQQQAPQHRMVPSDLLAKLAAAVQGMEQLQQAALQLVVPLDLLAKLAAALLDLGQRQAALQLGCRLLPSTLEL